MKRIVKPFFSVALVVMFVAQAQAGETKNEIDVTQATARILNDSMEISVTGSYTVEAGYTLCGVSAQARPLGGVAGAGGTSAAQPSGGSFSATINVPQGDYEVEAILDVKDPKGDTHYFFSNVRTVRAPS